MDIKFINEPDQNHPFLVIYKPSGLPSAPLTDDDKDNALSQAIKKYPQIKTIIGKKSIEYGLLHRLDTVTEGLLLIALSQDFYDHIVKIQNEGFFIKTYKAECEIKNTHKDGFPLFEGCALEEGSEFDIRSYFRGFGKGSKEVRPVTQNSGKYALQKNNSNKLYTTHVLINKIEKNKCFVTCKIKNGYRHQVRCHLCWAGLPIINDSIYNIESDVQICFKATGLYFNFNGEDFSFEL